MGTQQLGVVEGLDFRVPPRDCDKLLLNLTPPRLRRILSPTSIKSRYSSTKVHHINSSPPNKLHQLSNVSTPKLQYPSCSPMELDESSSLPPPKSQWSTSSPPPKPQWSSSSPPPKHQWSSSSPPPKLQWSTISPPLTPKLSLSSPPPKPQRSTSSPPPKPHQLSDFSIDHILRCAGPRHHGHPTSPPSPQPLFDWLHCTRYHPPKLQRTKKKDSSSVGSGPRRKLGRNPRIPFSAAQVAVLEERFRSSAYLSASDVSHLATLLRLSDTRIKIWFQNRRARERRDHGKVEVSQVPPPRRHPQESAVKSAFTPTETRH